MSVSITKAAMATYGIVEIENSDGSKAEFNLRNSDGRIAFTRLCKSVGIVDEINDTSKLVGLHYTQTVVDELLAGLQTIQNYLRYGQILTAHAMAARLLAKHGGAA